MVEVIQKGVLYWRVPCTRGCNSILEASVDDIKVSIDFEGDATLYVICPVCGVNVYGFKDIVPLAIQTELIDKAKGE